MTPQITPEGAIFLDITVHKDTPSATVSGSGGIAIDTKSVQTQVLVENGGTIVLGGIYQDTETVTVTKIPMLGESRSWATCSRTRPRPRIATSC